MKRSSSISGLAVALACGCGLTAGCSTVDDADGGVVYRVITGLSLADSGVLDAAVTAIDAARLDGDR